MMRLLRNLFAFVAGLATGRRTPTPRGGGALRASASSEASEQLAFAAVISSRL